jgi:hypothetical protein
MRHFFTLAVLLSLGTAKAAEPEAADIRATYRDGQTFVTYL